MRVGLLGLGTVNTAVARRLREEAALLEGRSGKRLSLAGAAVFDLGKPRDVDLSAGIGITDDAHALATSDSVDIVVEATPGTDPARHLIAAALDAGKHVVTANKAVMATYGGELSALALAHGVELRHGASVGAAVPILELLDNALAGDRISSIEAICNGTTNFVLEQMQAHGATFQSAIEEAKRLGFAEADPSMDVDGWDAVFKLVILAAHAWGAGVEPGEVHRRGIRDIAVDDLQRADEIGGTVKLLARAVCDGGKVELSVEPAFLKLGEHPLADVGGSENGFLINSDLAGTTLLRGAGAGGDPTASAIVNDVVALARLRAAS